jgi:hypothetical protein
MPSRRLTLPAVATLVVASLLLGALAAFADVARPAKREAAPVAGARKFVVRQPRAEASRALPPRYVVATPAYCVVATKPPAAVPVPQAILDAFGVLRRDRTADDDVPAAALDALRAHGLEPFDPAAARLLRTTAGGGRAWAVPVRDVPPTSIFGCRAGLVRAPLPAPVVVVPNTGKRKRLHPAVPQYATTTPAPSRSTMPSAPPSAAPGSPPTTTPSAPPATATVPVPQAATTPSGPQSPPSATAPTAPPSTTLAPATPPTATTPAPPSRPTYKPRPGVAIVAVGDAPVGAGGTLDDLVRGRENVAVDPCAGPGHDMLSVSGIVPDGVAAAFLTSADGTAIRADVKDNAYAFVVPPAKRPEQRYVVWTGGDGTPHVQSVASLIFSVKMRCPSDIVRVSAGDATTCGSVGPMFVPPTPTTPGRAWEPVPAPSLTASVPCTLRAIAVPQPAVTPRPTKRHHRK